MKVDCVHQVKIIFHPLTDILTFTRVTLCSVKSISVVNAKKFKLVSL